MGGTCGTQENRVEFRVLVGKPEGKQQLGTHRCRWMDNIKVDLRGTSWGEECSGMIWLRKETIGGLL